jgi:hypothetical protein
MGYCNRHLCYKYFPMKSSKREAWNFAEFRKIIIGGEGNDMRVLCGQLYGNPETSPQTKQRNGEFVSPLVNEQMIVFLAGN